MIALMPINCMIRSATTAPFAPSALRIGASVAWFRLGSAIDQVASATPRASVSAITVSPANS